MTAGSEEKKPPLAGRRELDREEVEVNRAPIPMGQCPVHHGRSRDNHPYRVMRCTHQEFFLLNPLTTKSVLSRKNVSAGCLSRHKYPSSDSVSVPWSLPLTSHHGIDGRSPARIVGRLENALTRSMSHAWPEQPISSGAVAFPAPFQPLSSWVDGFSTGG
jgi:hypothetical protein